MNTIYKEHEGLLQTTVQGNKGGHKQMEKYSMLMGRKNQYRENGHAAQSNLDIRYYAHQTITGLLHRTGKKTP